MALRGCYKKKYTAVKSNPVLSTFPECTIYSLHFFFEILLIAKLCFFFLSQLENDHFAFKLNQFFQSTS